MNKAALIVLKTCLFACGGWHCESSIFCEAFYIVSALDLTRFKSKTLEWELECQNNYSRYIMWAVTTWMYPNSNSAFPVKIINRYADWNYLFRFRFRKVSAPTWKLRLQLVTVNIHFPLRNHIHFSNFISVEWTCSRGKHKLRYGIPVSVLEPKSKLIPAQAPEFSAPCRSGSTTLTQSPTIPLRGLKSFFVCINLNFRETCELCFSSWNLLMCRSLRAGSR